MRGRNYVLYRDDYVLRLQFNIAVRACWQSNSPKWERKSPSSLELKTICVQESHFSTSPLSRGVPLLVAATHPADFMLEKDILDSWEGKLCTMLHGIEVSK